MTSYRATVTTTIDGTPGEPGPLVVGFRNARSGQSQQLSMERVTGGHLLHLAVAGCVCNNLLGEAAARGIVLTHVEVSADGGFSGDPCSSSGIGYSIRIEGDASQDALDALVAHVEQTAEVPSVIRLGGDVRLTSASIVANGR